jgi:hypothetical protein
MEMNLLIIVFRCGTLRIFACKLRLPFLVIGEKYVSAEGIAAFGRSGRKEGSAGTRGIPGWEGPYFKANGPWNFSVLSDVQIRRRF